MNTTGNGLFITTPASIQNNFEKVIQQNWHLLILDNFEYKSKHESYVKNLLQQNKNLKIIFTTHDSKQYKIDIITY